jgi:hypothetical protein
LKFLESDSRNNFFKQSIEKENQIRYCLLTIPPNRKQLSGLQIPDLGPESVQREDLHYSMGGRFVSRAYNNILVAFKEISE